jgi:rfaE bifunctional protein kinase chain/domain
MTSSPRSNPPFNKERVRACVEKFTSARIAVLGDIMLDRYFWGDTDRISPEAPVPVVRVSRRSERLGGAANVAGNLRALGVGVEMLGVVGDDRAGESVVSLLKADDVGVNGVVAMSGRETTEKVRIIARSQQIVRADFENEDAISDATARILYERCSEIVEACDALIVSDYGKGVASEGLLHELMAEWRGRGKPVLVDPHIPHFGWYRGATVITPNAREAQAATGALFDGSEAARSAADKVLSELELDALLVTRGEEGMSLYSGGPSGGPDDSGVKDDSHDVHIPTVAKEVYDVTGAGDTVISVLGAALATGMNMKDGVILANQGAGEVVKEVGTAILTAAQLVEAFPS